MPEEQTQRPHVPLTAFVIQTTGNEAGSTAMLAVRPTTAEALAM